MIDIDKILEYAVQKDASDIHLVPGRKPIIRVLKQLMEVEDAKVLEKKDMEDLYDYFISGDVYKDKEYNETRKLDFPYEVGDLRFRGNLSHLEGGMIASLRVIKNTLPKFEDLGIPDVVRRMMYQPQGLILVTGKTSSGKTTTLNALIDDVNQRENKKILTLEKPVEYKHKSKKALILQKEVGPDKDVLTYRDGVKNALREDCDILVIGEIRDRETMEAAIDMAESGHLVIGTLHTNSCAETIDRVINFYEIKDQMTIKVLMASLLRLIVSQRLIRGKDDKLVLLPEVMVVDNVVSGCLRKEKFSVSELQDAIQTSFAKGNVSLINSLAELYVQDRISLEQAKAQIQEKNWEILNRTIMQIKTGSTNFNN